MVWFVGGVIVGGVVGLIVGMMMTGRGPSDLWEQFLWEHEWHRWQREAKARRRRP